MERWNPWWFGERDPVYVRWSMLPHRWRPAEMELLALQPFSLNLVYGPRQVGKTTMLKLVINELLNRVQPRAILYLSCDEFSSYRELGEVLDTYLRARFEWGITRSYIFLDEVTFVEDWWRAVKARIDDGSLTTSVVTVTGSASLELLRQKELFPGRRGKGRDVKMMPLSFHSYAAKIHGLSMPRMTKLADASKAVDANKLFSEKIGQLFYDYLETGGFPLAIREKAQFGRVGEDSRRALLDGFRSDLLRVGKSESAMKEVISYLLNAGAAPISWLSISRSTSVASPNTARSYVETLEKLMMVLTVSYLEPSGKVIHRKNRKVHFTDPFIHRTLADYCRVEVSDDALVEGVVASHLSRKHQVFYWRDGGEVDCIAVDDGGLYGFEVKWGFKKAVKPKWIQRFMTLDRKTIPLFLSSLD